MAEKVTAIIDIGKTNKKFFLFDEKLDEVSHQYISFEEIPDEDGFLSENVSAIDQWMKECIRRVIADPRYDLQGVNFSTYGASFAHLDEEGRQATSFYNYLKPLDENVLESFFQKYGDKKEFSLATSSPIMGLLNSGFQLYYLKRFKPDIFQKIKYSLHFPQYLSFLLTGRFCSDYTSIGCHTSLWNFQEKNYHDWVIEEGLVSLLSPIVSSDTSFAAEIFDRQVNVGVGVHDSSSALIPYIQSEKEPFVLISTGTWSICMNYFNEEELTNDELELDCLNFLSVKGTHIKASRLFLGKEISHQVEVLSDYFGRDPREYEKVKFDPSFEPKRERKQQFQFNYEYLQPERFGFANGANHDLSEYDTFEEAYHQLMHELTDLQIASLKLAIGKTKIKTVFLDGGFSGNEVFLQMLANKLPEFMLKTSSFTKGTALGAAILVNKTELSSDFLNKNYKLKTFKPYSYSGTIP